MSFQDSACDIHLNTEAGATFLVAICNNEWGCGLTSEIRLDDYLGNQDGHFSWGGHDFTRNARDVSLSVERPKRWPVLHAELRNDSGDLVHNDLNLAEHIGNINGQLVFESTPAPSNPMHQESVGKQQSQSHKYYIH